MSVSKRSSRLPFLIAAAATLVVFFPSLRSSFQWDDILLLARPELQRPFLDAFGLFWSSTFLGHFSPFSWMSWALDHRLWARAPSGYHITNLLLHAANAVLAACLARRVLRHFSPGARENALAVGTLVAALFFSLHPLRVETVAWVTERRGLLSAFFGLGAFLAHERQREGTGKPWTAPILLLAAVLSKETAVMFPAAITLWALARGGWDARERRGLAVLWGVGFMGGAAGFLAVHRESIPVSWEEHGPVVRLLQVLRGSLWAVEKTLWPGGLSPLYELRLPSFPAPRHWWPVAGLSLGLSLVSVLRFRSRPELSSAWLIQGLILFPTSGILQSGPQITADRYTYVACLPWAMFLGWAALRLFALAFPREGAGSGKEVLGFAGVLLIGGWLGGLAGLSWRQQSFWRTPVTFWSRVVSVQPDSDYGHLGLAEALAGEGRWEESLAECRRSLVLEPTSVRALYATGIVLRRLGRARAAEPYFHLALRVDPSFALARRALEPGP